MIFKYTLWGIVLTAITGIIIVLAYLWKKNQKRRIFIDSLSRVKKKAKKNLQFMEVLRWATFATFVVCLLVLAMRPQNPISSEESKKGLDIILAVDVSGSMSIQDVEPSRIEVAQKVIKDFVSKIQTDRVGLVVFTGVPMTLSPLTDDYSIFDEYLELLTPDKTLWLSSIGGTAVGDAILLSTDKFQKNVERQKVVILITDGQSNLGINPVDAAQTAAKEKAKVYTIFISSYGDSRAKSTLKTVSDTTGAKSYSVENESELGTIFKEIDSLERTNLKTSTLTRYYDTPEVFMVLAALSWGATMILTLRRIV